MPGAADPPGAALLRPGQSPSGSPEPSQAQDDPQLDDLLARAVAALGGAPRPGQQQMARAVADALGGKRHLLVQAGTGTGKSLGYLVPVIVHAVRTGRPVVVSTATLALQAQVVDRDLPRLADALAPVLGRRPTWQLVKGRRNYVCVNKLTGGYPAEEDGLFELPEGITGRTYGGSGLGKEVVRLREWAEQTGSGDRDELVPGVSERAWRQVSVSAHECLGAQRCPMAAECHSERSRERAHDVDVVVSNHAFVAIDSFEGRQMLPEHEVLVFDEGHELADRVTSVITDELTPAVLEIAARRAAKIGLQGIGALEVAAALLQEALEQAPEGRIDADFPDPLLAAVVSARDGARALVSELAADRSAAKTADGGGARQLARAALGEVQEIAERLVDAANATEGTGHEVVWVSRMPPRAGESVERTGLHVAPLSVAGLVRERMFSDRTVVLTSATLALGGTFDAAAGAVGLLGEGAPQWTGLDVGSPFDYPRQAMLYVAAHLPPPGRDGIGERVLDEIAELVQAAGGRCLGLFSSRRAAEAAAEAMRERLDLPVLCQGDDSTPTLVREFAADAGTCLFGTLSLWQGVDVPGSACQLVIIDRIPFPRPDDPLAGARQRAVARAGGNGFMTVAATHAALRLAQGAGRLVRSMQDRGVVAVLDSRLATARYGGFLRASLPPFWPTTDRGLVLDALRRIDALAEPPVPVQPVAARPG
jgi:ATP-dependent DNA helicase DinG